jgi:hypothetical protein
MILWWCCGGAVVVLWLQNGNAYGDWHRRRNSVGIAGTNTPIAVLCTSVEIHLVMR